MSIILAYAEPPAVVAPDPARSGTITNPDWLAKPTGTELMALYPAEALRNRIEGRATMGCEVSAEGALVGCSVVQQDPPDAGFGDAALRMSGLFRMKPQTKDGRPTSGGKVNIPIRFNLPPLPTMTPEELAADAAPCPKRSEIRFYPEQARKMNVTGKAVLNCNISASRKLERCIILSEEPKSVGFGLTAVMIARCSMKPREGETGRIEFPVRFSVH